MCSQVAAAFSQPRLCSSATAPAQQATQRCALAIQASALGQASDSGDFQTGPPVQLPLAAWEVQPHDDYISTEFALLLDQPPSTAAAVLVTASLACAAGGAALVLWDHWTMPLHGNAGHLFVTCGLQWGRMCVPHSSLGLACHNVTRIRRQRRTYAHQHIHACKPDSSLQR